MDAADRITVDTIAQAPVCVRPRDDIRGLYDRARGEGFDWLPRSDPDGSIRRLVNTVLLEGLTTWDELDEHAARPGKLARRVSVDDLVAREAPIFSILDRMERPDNLPLLSFGPRGVDGIVTLYDLNQAAAHAFAFALALVVEGEVAQQIDVVLRERAIVVAEDIIHFAREAGVSEKTLDRWKTARSESVHLPFVKSLSRA